MYTNDIRYVKGAENVVADCLSRMPAFNSVASQTDPDPTQAFTVDHDNEVQIVAEV